jgi:hypothetical protein
MRYILLSLFGILSLSAFAQRIENIKAEVIGDGEKVIVTYDIVGASDAQKFKVLLYSSHNGYATPLSLISGDAGVDRELFGGRGKRSEWSAKSELKEFSGDITFEVRAELVSSFFIESPTVNSKFKKGKTLDVRWKGGAPNESVRVDLLKGGVPVSQIANVSSGQSYSWVIPQSMEKGKDYQVKLTANSGTSVSGHFGISKKIPTYVKILPLVVVGGVVVFILAKPRDKEKDLPAPPEPN